MSEREWGLLSVFTVGLTVGAIVDGVLDEWIGPYSLVLPYFVGLPLCIWLFTRWIKADASDPANNGKQ